ncbi:hypothetical protein IAT38_003458 [Cryptococcus sp. DSM 104549]
MMVPPIQQGQHRTLSPPSSNSLPSSSLLPFKSTTTPTPSLPATASSSAPQVTKTTADPRQHLRSRAAPPRFTITPAREAALPSISLVSPSADLASPGASRPGAVERITGQAGGEGSSSAAGVEVARGGSPIKRFRAGQPSTPALSSVTSRAELHVKGGARGKGKGKERAGEGELERGLDRVFTRHDRAKSLAGADSITVFRGTGRKGGPSPGVVHRPSAFGSAYVIAPQEAPATPPRTHDHRPHHVLVRGPATEQDDWDELSDQLLTPSTTAAQHHQPFSNFDLLSAFDRVSSQPTTPTAMPTRPYGQRTYHQDKMASSKGYGYGVPTGVARAERDAEIAPLTLGPPRVIGRQREVRLEDDEAEEDEEACARIDAVAAQIQAMVLQGQQALEASLPSSDEGDVSDQGDEGKNDVLSRWGYESEEEGGDLWDLVFGEVAVEGEEHGKTKGKEVQAHRKTASAEERGCDRPVVVRCRSVGLLAANGVDVL